MKKIGLLLITLVMALGALGVGYAAWTDEIYISGTVQTGDVDINITELSGTEVWKDLDTDALVYIHTVNGEPAVGQPTRPDPGLKVAEATAVAGEDPDEAVFTFTNLFPCQDFYVDMLLTYEGSIPAKINFAWIDSEDQWLVDLWNQGWDSNNPNAGGIWMEAFAVVNDVKVPVDLGTQVHEGDTIYLQLHIHIPQDNAFMNLSGSFTGGFQVIQWNEYPDASVIPTVS
ncbi:MAG: hypothetical protein P3T54_07885 [Dehalogenimonas sp.]|uniref:SipW-cognate class signal peptide n=1 Tax=Candidatus Dehalogenimonas loeffleri TaxID=3127115 RepID=A0ABZ2J8H9_9CHLR|nr:hypothetical protein [Dehalogenimonas sp.]